MKILLMSEAKTSFSTRVFQQLTQCLDGRSASCIHDNRISQDRLMCAIQKASRTTRILTEFKEMNIDGNESRFRYKLIQRLNESLGLNTDLDRARIDLDLSLSEMDQEEWEKMIFDTIMNLANNNHELRVSLLDRLREIFEGDSIVMTRVASDYYNFSKEGSEGVVIDIDGTLATVMFTKITGGFGGVEIPKTYEVQLAHMRKKGEKKRRNAVVRKTGSKIKGILDGGLQDAEVPQQDNSLELEKVVKRTLSDAIKQEKFLAEKENVHDEEIAKKLEALGYILRVGQSSDGEGVFALNIRKSMEFVSPEVFEVYKDRTIYDEGAESAPPPAELIPGVLALELTTGCNYGKCTYCGLYKSSGAKTKNFSAFKDHVDRVVYAIGYRRSDVRRIFIGSGNALSAPIDTLGRAVSHVNQRFNPQRISLYGNTRAILNKGQEGLHELRQAGLGLIYWGVESGATGVLKYVNKGVTEKDLNKASDCINSSGIDVSVMIMPGLGGVKFSQEHVSKTADFINRTDIKYLTLLTVSPSDTSKYKETMDAEVVAGTNRPLTDLEIVKQVRDLIELLEPRGQKIGMYGREIHRVGANPINLKGELTRSGKGKLLRECDSYIINHS